MTEQGDFGREPWIDPAMAQAAEAVAATYGAVQRERAAGVPWDATLLLNMTSQRARTALGHHAIAPPSDADVWLATTLGTRHGQEIAEIRELPEHDGQ